MLYRYAVGECVEEYVGRGDGPVFEIDDGGAVLLVFMRNPTEKEVEGFMQGQAFEMRFVEKEGYLFVVFKAGDLPWMDAPYNPRLSINWTRFDLTENDKDKGLSLTVMLIDTRTGEIKEIRLIGMSFNFTIKLIDAINKIMSKPDLGRDAVMENIKKTMSRYTSLDLAKQGIRNRFYI
mgnify:CR=1 FL=1